MLKFREVELDDAELILKWRTKKRVTRFMNRDIDYDLNAQRGWLESCYSKPSYYHWIVTFTDVPIGLIYLSAFDRKEATAAWGLYIGEDDYLSIGGIIPLHFYKLCFKHLKLM